MFLAVTRKRSGIGPLSPFVWKKTSRLGVYVLSITLWKIRGGYWFSYSEGGAKAMISPILMFSGFAH